LKIIKFTLPTIVLVAFLLRFLGIHFGLPGTVFPDEPHHINLAVYFGSGDLNPHVFKYPTLWMYFLFINYGLAFLFWSGFGLVRSASDFGQLFVWDPSLFYLIARGWAALFGTGAVLLTYYAGKKLISKQSGILAAAFMAVSPILIYYGHRAKADMMMLFLSTVAWFFCVRVFKDQNKRNYYWAGLFLGLAASAQYTAVILAPLLFWAHASKWKKNSEGVSFFFQKPLLLGYACLFLGFLLGTPFSLLDHPTFLADWRDLTQYGAGDWTADKAILGLGILPLWGELAQWGWLTFSFFAAGLWALRKKASRTVVFLIGPLIWCGIALGAQNSVAVIVNYTFSFFPGLALGMGAVWLWIERRKKSPSWVWGSLAVVFVPLFLMGWAITQCYLTTDTRVSAYDWINKNIPQGSRILLDQIHTSPPLKMSPGQIETLYKKTKEMGHPRARYYEFYRQAQKGEGYEILRVQRTADELVTLKRLSEWSQKAGLWLDVEAGWPALKSAGIDYVVWTSKGATPDNSPRLLKYFDDLTKKGLLIQEFQPRSYLSPLIQIYKIE